MLNVTSVQYRIGETSQQANSIVYWLIGFYYTIDNKGILSMIILMLVFTINT